MTELLVLVVLAAIVKLMFVTVFAGVRYRRRRDLETPPASDTQALDAKWLSAPRRI